MSAVVWVAWKVGTLVVSKAGMKVSLTAETREVMMVVLMAL